MTASKGGAKLYNRRGFFKSLGLLTGAVLVAPVVLADSVTGSSPGGKPTAVSNCAVKSKNPLDFKGGSVVPNSLETLKSYGETWDPNDLTLDGIDPVYDTSEPIWNEASKIQCLGDNYATLPAEVTEKISKRLAWIDAKEFSSYTREKRRDLVNTIVDEEYDIWRASQYGDIVPPEVQATYEYRLDHVKGLDAMPFTDAHRTARDILDEELAAWQATHK